MELPLAPSAFAVASALALPPGGDATAKVVGAAPFVEPERRFSSLSQGSLLWLRTLISDEPFLSVSF